MEELHRIRLDISYDGTRYFGWQRQPKTDLTIQSQMEIALRKLFQQNLSTIGSGRTDAGVHAYQQVLHFDIQLPVGAIEKYKLCSALNSMLPDDISVNQAFLAPSDFHALASAEKKYYLYRIYTQPFKNALLHRYHHHHRLAFDEQALNQMASSLVGIHDFKSYQSAGTPVASTEREIFSSYWRRAEDFVYEYHVVGSGFLKQMVRNLVGTMLGLCSDQQYIDTWSEILKAKNRSRAGVTAPACGLALRKVYYPEKLSFTEITC